MTPNPYSGPRTIRVRPKGRRRVKSGGRHIREICESYGRKTSRRPSNGQKSYRTKEPPFTMRVDVDHLVKRRLSIRID